VTDVVNRNARLTMKTKKNLIIVGDRVLIDPDERMDKTPSGLYLPPTVKEKEKIMGCRG
jgi:chaperonin GroES